MVRQSYRVIMEGGPGSGNFGHQGRPGLVGGSGSGGGGGFSIKGNVPKGVTNRVVQSMSIIENQKLLLKNENVEFQMGTYLSTSAGEYSPERILTDRFSGESVRLPATISLTKKISEPEIVHECGHHFDCIMGGKNPTTFWSDTEMGKWTGRFEKRENREIFADMFSVLSFKGSTYGKITIPSVQEDKRKGFHDWFDKSLKDFAKKK